MANNDKYSDTLIALCNLLKHIQYGMKLTLPQESWKKHFISEILFLDKEIRTLMQQKSIRAFLDEFRGVIRKLARLIDNFIDTLTVALESNSSIYEETAKYRSHFESLIPYYQQTMRVLAQHVRRGKIEKSNEAISEEEYKQLFTHEKSIDEG